MSPKLLDLWVFVGADESQVEIRMLAEASGDKLLLSQFETGQDIHCKVGNALTGWPESRIANEKALRRMVKEIHFAVVYGVARGNLYDAVVSRIRSIEGAKANLKGITRKQLVFLYDRYFEKYKGVRRYIQKMRQMVEDTGRVETMFGFPRAIFKDDEDRSTYWGNQAINTPIQGAAHQLILIAMALLHLKPVTYRLLRTPLMEVHDELCFRVRLRDLPKAYTVLVKLLEKDVPAYVTKHFGFTLRVPLKVEVSAGFCRGSMMEYKGGDLDEFLNAWREKHKKVELTGMEDLLPTAVPV